MFFFVFVGFGVFVVYDEVNFVGVIIFVRVKYNDVGSGVCEFFLVKSFVIMKEFYVGIIVFEVI